eukprot:TRINITY_DN17202_c0_g1::TRINITY_DN17202_c0_g1_i1::g.11684::m.11684 TRINITY_DN17202_c0_g1::TRINITY_DN17202_c0_g1_i1::g.11684  ORF type:complete len:105 (-),score=19.43 TRINITY_DN17202_c0_g1_i1:252-524(-)
MEEKAQQLTAFLKKHRQEMKDLSLKRPLVNELNTLSVDEFKAYCDKVYMKMYNKTLNWDNCSCYGCALDGIFDDYATDDEVLQVTGKQHR